MDGSQSWSSETLNRSQPGTNDEAQSSGEDRRRPSCPCGLPSIQRTSWTDENPGRRFFGCSRYTISCLC
ncbi:MAG: hypothetical protein EOP45_20800 [Sphingobacteriaceae bacterium]|nr:MAG: hypothetical protein EOP45_20800 [Sphingobacteriaceae bacterium]